MIPRADDATARLRSWYDTHPLALDASLLAFVTFVGGLLRLIRLGDIPYGVHPDEAQIGTDAVRVLDHGWIGVYSHAALGVPTLNAYLTVPGVWLLGHTAFSLRLPLALVGLAAVPLMYLVVRVAYTRLEAFFASLLLAISYWHIFYSRVAHSSISYPTILLGSVLCLMLGMNTKRWPWFAAAGVLLGLGVYAYNVDAIAIVAVVAFFAAMALVRYRRDRAELRWWGESAGICFGTALIVALPFIVYISHPDAYYWTHIDDYRNTGVLRSQDYRDASAGGKVKLIADQLRDFFAAYAWKGQPDIIDANGLRPMFDPVTLVLFVAGVAIAVALRREPMMIASFCFVLILPLPALLQRGSMMREPLGAAPFAMFFAALPLAWVWRRAVGTDSPVSTATAARSEARAEVPQEAPALALAGGDGVTVGNRSGSSVATAPRPFERLTPGVRFVAAATVVIPVAVIGWLTIHDYFWTWRHDPLTRYVYHQEMTSASTYMKTLPPDAYVYFYSERHPLSLENRQWLAPDVQGEDRSAEFSDAGGSIDDIDRSRPSVFVLLGDYLPLLPQIERTYPGGVERIAAHDGLVDFAAYEVPPA